MILLKERHIEPKSELEPKFEPEPSARLSSEFEKKSFFSKQQQNPSFPFQSKEKKKQRKIKNFKKGAFEFHRLKVRAKFSKGHFKTFLFQTFNHFVFKSFFFFFFLSPRIHLKVVVESSVLTSKLLFNGKNHLS